MNWTNSNYYRAYDHNYRNAYSTGQKTLSEGASQKESFRILSSLLRRTGLSANNARLLDLGCGDGDNGMFLSKLGYRYTGMDVSLAAVKMARERAKESASSAVFQVGNAIDFKTFPKGRFAIVLDSYCFHMFILDSHRARYFENVRKVLGKNGKLVLLAARSDKAVEGPFASFRDFCRKTGTDPKGIPFQKCVAGHWENVKGKRVFLMGYPRSLGAYKREFAKAGFAVEYVTSWRKKAHVAFVLRKVV